MSAMATTTQLVAFAANLILFEYIVILPLQTFKMISNKQKYCEAGCEVLVKEQCIDLLFFVNFLRTSPPRERGKHHRTKLGLIGLFIPLIATRQCKQAVRPYSQNCSRMRPLSIRSRAASRAIRRHKAGYSRTS
jgi:hypothetical protein